MYALSCDKLSHCIFDFDCPDYEQVYQNEKFEMAKFRIRGIRCDSQKQRTEKTFFSTETFHAPGETLCDRK